MRQAGRVTGHKHSLLMPSLVLGLALEGICTLAVPPELVLVLFGHVLLASRCRSELPALGAAGVHPGGLEVSTRLVNTVAFKQALLPLVSAEHRRVISSVNKQKTHTCFK